MAGVPSAEMDRVSVELFSKILDRQMQQFAPTDLITRPRHLSQQLIVSLAFEKYLRANIANLLNRTLNDESNPESRAQGKNELPASSIAVAECRERRIIDHSDFLRTRISQGSLQVEVLPRFVNRRINLRGDPARARKITGLHHDTIVEIAGKPNTDA